MSEQADGTSAADERRELYRQQVRASIGGWSGTIVASVPTVVFVAVNATVSLRPAIAAAVATALVLAGVRAALHQPVQQALGGLFGVLVAAAIAGGTGQARGYFLLGIVTSFVYGGVLLVSVLVRRPLVGVLWEFVDPTPGGGETPWWRRPVLLRAYTLATLGAVAVFAARGIVQLTLFEHNSTGWLAVARLAMGYPLYLAAIGFGLLVVRRARRTLDPA